MEHSFCVRGNTKNATKYHSKFVIFYVLILMQDLRECCSMPICR